VKSFNKKDNRAIYRLILAFVLLAAGIITAGYLSYRNYANQYRAGMERQLSAIADLKVGDLAHWRKERIGDAAVFYGNEAFSFLIHRYFNNPNDLEVQRHLWTWLSKVQLRYSYERLLLFDARGTLRMSVPDSKEPVASNLSQRAAIVMRSEQIDFQDFYRDEQNQRLYLTIMVPILSKEAGSQTLGVLVLRIDPETYLYPFIRYWPIPSQTAETLLARREGNEALFLNDLRFQKDTALKLRVPLENVELPTVKAVLGQEGIVEGKDYRGIPVIAAIRSIPDSPWFLTARMDLSEVYGPLKERFYLMIILVVALLIGIGTVIGLVWRQQHIRLYRKKYEAAATLTESEERYRTLVEYASDAVFKTDNTGHFTFVNPAMLRITGYEEDEIIGMQYSILIRPDMRDEAIRFFGRQFVKGIQNTYSEYPILTKDGHEAWLGQNTRLIVEDDHVVGFQAMARDLMDRKRMEAEILALSITDQLTGLHNRRGFLSLAGQQLKLSDRNKRGVQLYFADLDGLKWINDTLGHEEGDKALIEAATVFKETFRTSDIIARLGGDEYAALAIDITEEYPDIFTARLQSMIDAHNLQENRRYRLSISVGCSYYDPENPCSIDKLMASADKMMYEQKQNKKSLLLQVASLSSSNPYPSMHIESKDKVETAIPVVRRS
jgi:diguanylate cyclase (GGDEF)-like protein/PAS domain S-box-containing protein